MKITFIRPNIFDSQSFGSMEVLSIAILKSLTPPDIETVFFDDRLGVIPYDDPTDLVAMTVETFTARRAYQIAEKYRSRGVKVVMGGFHPTAMPEEAQLYADVVVQGDAEDTWPQIVSDAGQGRLKPFYRSSNNHSLSGTLPDHTIFKDKNYVPMALVQYSRGCKYNCSFCSIHAFYGSSIRYRPVSEVVSEIKSTRARHVMFVDDNIFQDTMRAEELFTSLIPLKIRWSCQVSIDVARHPDILRLMKESGCVSALIGFESLNEDNLKIMNKSWNTKWADYETSIRNIQNAGIMIYGTFVLGWDNDDISTFDRTVEFAIRNRFVLGGFNPLMPTPGTRIYNKLKKDGRLIYDRWWIDPDYKYGQAVFKPKQMTAAEFTAGCFHARKKFSSMGSILRRTFHLKTHLNSPYRFWAYMYSNYLLRREIHTKQWKNLGSMQDRDPYKTFIGSGVATGDS